MAKRGKTPSLTIDHKMDLHFELDSEKVAQIKKCLEKGKLTISVNKVDLTSIGRSGNGYLYD
jgi:anti-sigma28 factor (negative regulator of flagellin synthesis)